MPDAYFEDAYLASLYDIIEQRGRPDEAFYADLARSADRVLDVGCGTGALLHTLRDAGHPGRLAGIDPAGGMLARARRRDDIEWFAGYLPAAGFDGEFDLAYMTGHAFQVLLDDDAVTELFTAVRRALVPTGRFAFETRNPAAQAWRRWNPDDVVEVVDERGRAVRVWHEVESLHGELVTFTETFDVAGAGPIVSRSTLRFAYADGIDAVLARAGLVVDERYGDWDRSPFTDESPEIITVAVSP